MHQRLSKNRAIIFSVAILAALIGAPTASAVAFAHNPTRDRSATTQNQASSARRTHAHHDAMTSAENERCTNQAKGASSGTPSKEQTASSRKRGNDCGA